MFWNRRKTPPIRSLVGEGTVVRGDLEFEDGLRIDGEVVGDIRASDEGREGVQAFLNKREPNWR